MQKTTGTDDSAVIKEVRWRYRICNYLFRIGALWIFAGYAGAILTRKRGQDMDEAWFALLMVGAGIFSAAFALTMAIYRCPVCDKYLSRFRPDKTKCPRCGARVRETSTGRP
jgi:ssDNA-binding Zn-finger/Zn-ribbon topoisomerase 1